METVTQTPPLILAFPQVFAPFVESEARYTVLVGGAGSGKSYTAAQKMLMRVAMEPQARILVVRKVGATLRRSVFQLFRDLIVFHDLSAHFRISLTDRRIECLSSGGQLLFCGLDDPEKIKSIQGITSIWVEEATELDDADFRQLELRLRGDTVGYKQVVLTCNPTSNQNWVYTRFCGPESVAEDVLGLNSTAFDNPYIDTDYLDILATSVATEPDMYRIYTRGEWGASMHKDLYYKKFDAREHVRGGLAPNRELPLHLSFDFNVQPYLTCTIWQADGSAAWQIDELCLEGPNNLPTDLARALLKRYGHKWPAGVYLYGDPNGNSRHSASPRTAFQQIRAGLEGWHPVERTPSKAPGVAIRGQWINRILGDAYDGLSISIGNSCKHTLADYTHVKEDTNGTKRKIRVKDRATGQTYEPYGHCSDANDYFLCTYWASSFARYSAGDKKLLDPVFG